MRAVVTGATSMIGSALAAHALARGDEVLAIVRPGSARRGALPRHPRLTIVECALDRLGTWSPGGSWDAFFHLAWDKTGSGQRDDVRSQSANIGYALDAVDLAARLGCTAFVGAGSQAEYGPVNGPMAPGTPADPRSGYGVGKYAAGKLCALACRDRMRFGWARILSVYGPGDNPGSLISYCIRTLLAGETPALTPCDQTWDYLHRNDAARGLYLIGERGRDGGVYPLGSGEAHPLSHYVEALRDAIDPALPLGFGEKPYYPHQAPCLHADITALTADTGFVPEIPFARGIQTTIDWYKEHIAYENN